ncbi:MAG: sensor histidine kinase [Lachnospiraceae bacterium]
MKRIWKSSILAKLLLGTVFVLLVPFILVNGYAYQVNYNTLLEKTIEENEGLLGVGLDSVEEYFGRLNKITLSVYENTTLHNVLQSDSSFSGPEQYSLRKIVDTMVAQDTSIRQVELICKNGEVITQEEIGADNAKDWRNAEYRNSGAGIQPGYDSQGQLAVLKYGVELADEPSSDILVQINFYCVLDQLELIARKVGANNKDRSVVAIYMNDSDEPLYTNEPIEALEYLEHQNGYSIGKLGGRQGFFFIGYSSYSGQVLKIMKFVPQSAITGPLDEMIGKMAFSQVIILLFVILFLIFINKNMIRPIKNIAKNIDKVQEGQYEYHATSAATDEIGELERKYEEMVKTINLLINKDLKNALEISKARLKMLQAQINPHFLNNMLQTISTQAMKCQDREASNSLSKLARIFEYNMDTSTDHVPLAVELKQIQTYLELQKSRFRDRLEYTIECDEWLESVIVPKMVIQPLVENSIQYGVARLEGIGRICIKVYQEKKIIIEVIDNGIGISDDEIRRLQEAFKNYKITPEAGHGIGLINVLQRLDLYSNDFAWEIRSVPNIETRVILRFEIPGEEV